MKFSYNNLWKLLIDKGMSKQDLCASADLSRATLAKLGRGENVTTNVLLRICGALDCQINEICEVIKDDQSRYRSLKS